jgi:hypothetical protein
MIYEKTFRDKKKMLDIIMFENFKKNGFVVKKIFDDSHILEFERTFVDLCNMQLKKLKIKSKFNNIQKVAKLLNKKNPKALDEVCFMARNSSSGHNLASNDTLIKVSNLLLKNKKQTNIISGPSMFVNFPDSVTRKYTYHSEQTWYPKRRNFLNIWCPIFKDRCKQDSMELKIKSNEKDWFYFSEYYGYDGEINKDSYVQYEIPKKFLKEYKSVIPKVKKNEGIFFDGKTVHRSVNLKSKQVLFAIVFRVYNYTNDLTLSANWADIPYNRQSFGVPEIDVD